MGVVPPPPERLADIEAIRRLRALYSHLLDGHDIDALVDLFVEDAVCEVGSVGYDDWVGRAAIAEGYRGAAVSRAPAFQYLHAATNALIDFTSDVTATGRWFLVCLVLEPDSTQPVAVAGVYDEAYRKVDGAWYIERMRIDHPWRKPR